VHDQTTDKDRYVELHDLACGDCDDHVADGPDGFTHDDGTPLCDDTTSPETSGPASPVELTGGSR